MDKDNNRKGEKLVNEKCGRNWRDPQESNGILRIRKGEKGERGDKGILGWVSASVGCCWVSIFPSFPFLPWMP